MIVPHECRNCRFFSADMAPGHKPEEALTGGECRKRAPMIGTGQWADRDCAPYAYWPVVAVKYWCGDFRASSLARKKFEKRND